MQSKAVKWTIGTATALAATALLSIAGLSAWIYWRAERTPDVVEFQLFVLYDCARYGVTKGDRRFVQSDRSLEGCGVPNAELTFFDARDRLLLKGTADRRGEFRFFRNTIVDDPVTDIRRVAIETARCRRASYPVKLESRHNFQGESMASRAWRYRGRFKIFCDYLEKAQGK